MKKLFALLLTVAFLVSLFTACSSTKEVTYYVGANLETDDTHFKTLSQAIEKCSELDSSVKKTIYIQAGSYNEKITIPENCQNLTLVGSVDGETKITFGDYASMLDENGQKIGTDKTATANVHANNFSAKNIYFENSFDYFRTDITGDKQALAMYCKADKVIFENCIFTGYQDTLEVVSGRQYFKDCTIKGCVDFIFGNNPSVLFENCDIVNVNRNNTNGGYVTAMKGNNGNNGQEVAKYGLVFKGCRLTAEEGVYASSVALGRPWRADATVAWINCEMGAHIGTVATGRGKGNRYTTMDGGGQTNYPMNAFYAEYNNTGLGATTETLYCIYQVREGDKIVGVQEATVPDFKHLTDDEALTYTAENIFAKVNGQVNYSDEWNYQSAIDALSAK